MTLLIFSYYSFPGCDKDMLINILTQRCNAQRLMIAEAYQSMHGRVRSLHLDLCISRKNSWEMTILLERRYCYSFQSHRWQSFQLHWMSETVLIYLWNTSRNIRKLYHQMFWCVRYIHTHRDSTSPFSKTIQRHKMKVLLAFHCWFVQLGWKSYTGNTPVSSFRDSIERTNDH